MGGSEGIDDDLGWASELEREYNTSKGKVPEGDGWMTFENIQKEMDCGIVKARRVIKKAKEDGRIEVFTGSEKSETCGYLTRQVWYRIVKD